MADKTPAAREDMRQEQLRKNKADEQGRIAKDKTAADAEAAKATAVTPASDKLEGATPTKPAPPREQHLPKAKDDRYPATDDPAEDFSDSPAESPSAPVKGAPVESDPKRAELKRLEARAAQLRKDIAADPAAPAASEKPWRGGPSAEGTGKDWRGAPTGEPGPKFAPAKNPEPKGNALREDGFSQARDRTIKP